MAMEGIPQAVAALAESRVGETQRIAMAVRENSVVGILGEAEVGKTQTIRQALDKGHNTIYLNLEQAADDGHVGFLLARQIARTVVGPVDFSLLRGGAMLPAQVELGRQRLAELLGIQGLNEALRSWPSGNFQSTAALEALATLATQLDLVLWIDHVEAPFLTPRHPLAVGPLLWGVRELSQRVSGLRVVLSAREALRSEILGPTAAFHQQGLWLSLKAPVAGAWQKVADRLDAPPGAAEQLTSLTEGHPATMLLALLSTADAGSRRALYPEDVLQEMAIRDDGLAIRAMQHARTLHRLGGQVLTQIALSQRPYAAAQRGSASTQEIRKILNRLRLAGLLRKSDGWAVVNPLVAIRLRGTVHGPLDVEDDDVSR